jgi:predicted Zn finger-like uncharacterized protein
MKVQCEHCGAAYSVADEKVAGRKLRQRCRKCGESIIIDGSGVEGSAVERGSAAPAEAESFAVSVPPDTEAVWHIAVGDTTQGPYTLEELGQYYADGHIVLDTLVCRDGWSDWKQAGEVPELVTASRSTSQPVAGARSRGVMVPQHVAAQTFGQPVAMGSDPFGEAPIAPSSPRVSVEEMATPGMQRDGTVQFSMDEIRALSAVSMPSVAPVSSSTLPGRANGDDSGLIDMRALAAAEAEAVAAAALAAQNPVPGGYRPFSPSQVSPLQAVSPLAFAAHARPNTGLDTRTKVMAGLAAFGLVLFAVVIVVAMQRGAAPAPVAAAAPAVPAAAAEPVAAAQPEPAADEAAPALPAAAVAAEPAQPVELASTTAASAKNKRRGSSDGDATAARSGKRKAQAEADESPKAAAGAKDKGGAKAKEDDDSLSVDDILAKKPAPTKKGSPDIDDLLDGAISSKKAAPKEEPAAAAAGAAAAGGALPATPSREQMKSAYGQASAKASKCKGPGVATTNVTISGKSGRATSVNVAGVEGPAKSCVEKAVRSTSFPKFQKDSMEVKFPFKLAG